MQMYENQSVNYCSNLSVENKPTTFSNTEPNGSVPFSDYSSTYSNYSPYYTRNAHQYNNFNQSSQDQTAYQYPNYYNSYYNMYSCQPYPYQSTPYPQYISKDFTDTTGCQTAPNTYHYLPTNEQNTISNTHAPEPEKSTTPEKQMNDSGIDVISPQLAFTSFNSSSSSNQYHQSPVEEFVAQKHSPPRTSNEEEEEVEDDQDIESEKEENEKQNPKSNEDTDAKPPKAYLEIIADAILSCNVKMMQLHEIYNYMECKYAYFAKGVNKSWRNSVRHNLSLNECFVKAGRGSNGKGNYWRIHPLVQKEFIRGNFRRKTFKKLIKAGRATNNQSAVVETIANYTDPQEYCLNYRAYLPPFSVNGQYF